MDDVIAAAKSSGEFEGSVEDIRATSVELASAPETITTDSASGAMTMLATFNVDRGCSLDHVGKMCSEVFPEGNASSKESDDDDSEDLLEPNTSVAKSGFYMTKRQIMGRTLVLFAKRKIQWTKEDEEDIANRIDYDPLGLMILTRPNTGTNPYDMSTADLERKYRLVASIDDIRRDLKGNISPESVIELLKEKHESFVDLWEETYSSADAFDGTLGMAPRHSKLGIGKL